MISLMVNINNNSKCFVDIIKISNDLHSLDIFHIGLVIPQFVSLAQ